MGLVPTVQTTFRETCKICGWLSDSMVKYCPIYNAFLAHGSGGKAESRVRGNERLGKSSLVTM